VKSWRLQHPRTAMVLRRDYSQITGPETFM